ncbi:SseB family protein [Dyella mobilis]|uniref:SseB family protein n=2 Tax=Dyella mobilis TaxID=1849582 RepID=A0ABS2KBV5_9GAMM|nr:SseB family protein [Dyella mobilis]MBM7128666.1 SseB family protein [Dyella mobilis]GLQ98988.1 hypothetical protein GCM10007863_34080 [Dyella mobilis]
MASHGPEGVAAQDKAFRAILDATVYAHVPVEPSPSGRLRFIQFVRPDNGQTVLPFFSDLAQAEQASSDRVSIMAMAGRRLFEITRGATLMFNPNSDAVALYPPEVIALLGGKPIGYFTKEALLESVLIAAGLPSVSTEALDSPLRALFESEPPVRAAYLTEVHREGERAEVFLLLTIVAARAYHERIHHLVSLVLTEESPDLSLPLSITFAVPDEPLPLFCHEGIQFYGT